MNAKDVIGKSFLVYGAGKSGLAAMRLLLHAGAMRVALADDKRLAEVSIPDETDVLVGPEQAISNLSSFDFVVKSPGIEAHHPAISEALRRNVPVVGELELAWALRPEGTRILAITGTNGKTTTTAWTAFLLQKMGSPAIAVGNIGLPFAEALLEPRWNQPGTIYVVEASSFQLEDIDEFHPDVAIMTNFTADHLDRYGSLEKYFQAKQRIWKNMGPDDLLVVNSDDPACEHFAVGAACTVGHFTRRELTNFNADVPLAWVSEEGMIWIRTGGSESTAVPLISADEVSLPGPHNLENALAAVMASAALLPGNSLKGLCEGLRHFSGVPHRIELCGSSRGVRFYNDSKATNVDATEKALRSFSPGTIVLIAGGRDKQSDYGAITPLVKERVRALVTLGEAGPLVEAAWGPPVVPTLLRATTMSEAVELAAAAARPGDTVLLSPACASFDMYRNYEHRGDDFKATVSNHISNQTR